MIDKNIIEAKELPDNEKIYFRKNWFFSGYHVVHPYKDENGKINWINLLFGGRDNLFTIIFTAILLFLFYFGVQDLLMSYKSIAENPCSFCDCANQFVSTMKFPIK